MKIVYVLRRSKEWSRGDRSGPYIHDMNKYVALWNNTFTMTYADFRGELSDIRESALNLAEYDIVVESWQSEFAEIAKRPGMILVGCDEDDWIDNDTPRVLRKLGDIDKPVRWDFVHYQGPWIRRITHPFRGGGHTYMSCNFALPTPIADTRLLTNHSVTDKAYAGGPEIYLPMALSVQCRTPASASLIKEKVTDERSLRDLMCEWTGPVERQGLETPSFCLPMVEMVRGLCHRTVFDKQPIQLA